MPSPASKPIVATPKKKKSGPNPLESAGVRALIFIGGGALLAGVLLLVVWPALQRQKGPADLIGQAAFNIPGIPKEMREAMEKARPGENGFPQLPPPLGNEYPAGTNPAEGGAGEVRANVVAQLEQAINEMIGYLDEFSGVFETIRDEQSARDSGPRVQDIVNRSRGMKEKLDAVPSPTPAEARELARRVEQRARAAITRLRAGADRIAALPGVGLRSGQLTQGVNLMSMGLEQLLAGPQGGQRPFVELYVEGVMDSDESQVLHDKLGPLTDNPAAPALASFYVGGGTKASYRVCPVADPQAFAQKLRSLGKTSVSGYKITLTGFKVDQGELAKFKSKLAAERGQDEQLADAGTPAKPAGPDPEPPAGADALTRSLFKLKSSKIGRQHEGLAELERAIPDSARRDEVVDAVIPLATSRDNSVASAAIRVLGNWSNQKALNALGHVLNNVSDGGLKRAALEALLKSDSQPSFEAISKYVREGRDNGLVKDAVNGLIRTGRPEVAPLLAYYVEHSDDPFGRGDAIKALARMKAPEAAEAIALRISDNWAEAPDALRALGAPAEPVVIKLLSDGNSEKRKAACLVLRDIGGAATFEAMLGLPADSDPFVQDEARKTMEVIAQRIGPEETKRLQSQARGKR